jgi:hypothetical protein
VTGAVLDALESPRVQEALRDGDLDSSAPRRAELLADIQRAQEVRADARRDLVDGIIDRADWLDIRQRTEDSIAKARREYDRLSGSATVMSDIPPSERVRDAWESWGATVSVRQSGLCCTGSSSTPSRRDCRTALEECSRIRPCAASARWRSYASVSNSTGAYNAYQRAPSICGESFLVYWQLKGS